MAVLVLLYVGSYVGLRCTGGMGGWHKDRYSIPWNDLGPMHFYAFAYRPLIQLELWLGDGEPLVYSG